MGVAVRSIENLGHTDQLVDWITKIKCKKNITRRQKRKNLFVEAVLTYTLTKAEVELRHKQQERMRKWKQIKTTLCNHSETEPAPKLHIRDCEELHSLENFMSQLKQVKCKLR